jgi:hypothetical protein
MHFSRLIRIGCVSGLAASPILAQNLPSTVEHPSPGIHESAENANPRMTVRDQLVARITMLQSEGKLSEKQAAHLQQDVARQIAQAERSRDALRLVAAAGQLETRIDTMAGATQAAQIHAQSELATRKGLNAEREFEAKVAIARSRREAQLTADAVLAEGARRERQAKKMEEFAALQIARLDALNPIPAVSSIASTTSIASDANAPISTVHSKAIEVLHAGSAEPAKTQIATAPAVEKVAPKDGLEAPVAQSQIATTAPSADQIEKLQAAALDVLHAQPAEVKKASPVIVARNNTEPAVSQAQPIQQQSAPVAPSADQIEKLQAAALEVLHARPVDAKKPAPVLVAQNNVAATAPQQPVQPQSAAAAPSPEQIEKLQAAALEVLHSQPAAPAADPSRKPAEGKSNKIQGAAERAVSSKFARPAEAPADAHERAVKELREKMQKPVTAPSLTEEQIAKGQERAIEALHQASSAAVPAPAPAEESDKELQKRAREIVRQQKAEAEQARLAAKNADAAIQSKNAPAPATTAQVDPAVLERARAILREHRASETTNATAAKPSAQPASPSQTALPKLKSNTAAAAETPAPSAAPSSASTFKSSLPPASDEALERARAVLRQPQAAATTPSAMPTPTTTQLGSSVPAASPGSGLNEKTRQLLIRQNKELEKSAGKTPTPAPATDSGKIDPYARAREVLRNQPNSTKDAPVSPAVAAPNPSAPASPAIVTPPASAVVRQAAPAAVPAAVVSDAQPSSTPNRNDAVLERAREILRQQKASTQTAVGTVAPAAVTPAPAAPVASQPAPAPRTAAPAAVDAAVVHARALEALHAQEAAEKKTTPVAVAKPTGSAEKPAPIMKPAAPAQPVQNAPVVQAAPSVKTKKEKLADLLELYKADKITPSQYQEQRAKIIAEP